MNPYHPGAGVTPMVLAGRDADIAAFDSLIVRAKRYFPVNPIVFSGLRGVGKTVLLNRLRGMADHHQFHSIQFEAKAGKAGATAAKRELARGFFQISAPYRRRAATDTVKQMLGTVSSFSVSLGLEGFSFGLENESLRGASGLLEMDLQEVIEDISLALRREHSALVIFIDEMQELEAELLESLLTVQHYAMQRQLPFYIIGAGLPNLPVKLAASRSYAERLFEYRVIGKLDDSAARESLVGPANKMGQVFTEDALEHLTAEAGNYPFFLQVFGSAIWTVATASPFTVENAHAAKVLGRAQLDSGFFPARWERATPAEREYLRAMAMDGDEGSRSAAIARALGKTPQGLAPVRASLIAKGIIYSPLHGRVAFTVPGMSSFIERQRQLLED
ncbi:ATP-binding protein [Glutamicibacter arilaitensis]|uniref:ATP-binding protein n=1 Tax=Glutamicibacter arilaitensis TaxID=256701 RepID=UPI003A948BE8